MAQNEEPKHKWLVTGLSNSPRTASRCPTAGRAHVSGADDRHAVASRAVRQHGAGRGAMAGHRMAASTLGEARRTATARTGSSRRCSALPARSSRTTQAGRWQHVRESRCLPAVPNRLRTPRELRYAIDREEKGENNEQRRRSVRSRSSAPSGLCGEFSRRGFLELVAVAGRRLGWPGRPRPPASLLRRNRRQ